MAALLLARGAGGGGAAAAGARVVVVAQPVAAGESLDPARLRLVDWPAERTPPGALTRVEDAAFRVAAVALPVGLPLVPSLLRAPGRTSALRQGERAVGVRVDEVGGLAGLLRAGARVDVLVSGPDEDGPVEQVAERRRGARPPAAGAGRRELGRGAARAGDDGDRDRGGRGRRAPHPPARRGRRR